MFNSFVIFFILLSGFTNAFTQGNSVDTSKSPHVVWIKQFPDNSLKNNNVNFSKKISNVILGKNDELTLSKPISLITIGVDSIIVLDQGNSQIFEITKKIIPIKLSNKKNYIKYESLIGICKNKTNHIYYTDSKLNKVFDYDSNNKIIRILNDTLVLNQPTGIAYSNIDKNIWIVETAAHRLTVLNEQGKIIKHIGERGNGNAEFNFPTNICIDDDGNVYVVDAMNFRVQIFDKDGEFLSTFGTVGDASGYFARPKGIALDTFGNIYISDALFHGVQVFDKKGDFLYRFGEQGHENSQFWMPSGLFIDENNYIYVADSYNSRIQIFKLVNERKDD